MIDIEERHKKIIFDILNKHPYHFYAFGSRVKGKAKRFSDLDLCFFDKIPDKVISDLEEQFEESNLPYTVDIVDWNSCDPSFQEIIKKDAISFVNPTNNSLKYL
jgi:predicted nucleotidyltransferase